MKKLLLIIFFKSSWCMAQDYKIMSIDELLKMVTNRNEQFEYQDSNTSASVYKISDNKFILFPANGQKGILAEKKSVLDSIIRSGVIPIEEEKPKLLQIEKLRLMSVQDNINYYLNELNSKLQISISTDKGVDTSLFKSINKEIKLLEGSEAYKTYFIPLGVVIGEIIRLKVKGDWQLDKRYAYNPYYVPYVTDSAGNKYNPWYKLADMLLNKKFDIKQYIQDVSTSRSYL